MHRVGYAKGGPRDGVRLSANPDVWDGRIRYFHAIANARNAESHYPGYYEWHNDTWVWRTDNPPPKVL